MSDLEQLRLLTAQVQAPSFAALEETARRRDRRAATAILGAGAVLALVVAGALNLRSDDQTIQPIEPDPDRTQNVIEADYGTEAVHRFETHQVSNTGADADATDLSVTADFYEGSTFNYWCTGDPSTSYIVQVTGGTDADEGVAIWRGGGSCDGEPRDHGEGYTGTGPPPGPTDSMSSQNMRFSPLSAEDGKTSTVRIVLSDGIPDSITGCFDLPGGPPPKACTDESAVQPIASPGDVEFGAVIFTRPVEYVATVAGVPVQAQASTDGEEYLFAGGVESMPGSEKVTLETDTPGFVYLVQSDPQGRAECQEAYDNAPRGDGFADPDDMSYDCEKKEAEVRLLVDGRPVTQKQTFPQSGDWQGWFDFGSVALDPGHHVVTAERVKGSPQVVFGLVQFEASDG